MSTRISLPVATTFKSAADVIVSPLKAKLPAIVVSEAAPAAIAMSLEGVVAAIAAWIILNQILGLDNIIGCTLILFGVLFSQLYPIYESKTKNI